MDWLEFMNTYRGPITRTLAVLITFGLFALFWKVCRRVFRHPRGLKVTGPELEQLLDWKNRRSNVAALPALLLGVGCGYGFFWGLVALEEYRNRVLWGDTYLLYYGPADKVPGTIEWALPAVLMGAFCTWWAHACLLRLFYGREAAARYRLIDSLRAGYDTTRLRRVALALGVPGTLVLALVLLDWYVRIDQDRFVVNEVWSFREESHAYSEIKEVVLTTHTRAINGKESEYSWLYVVFTDGSHWSSSPSGYYRPLIELLQRKTRKPARVVRHIDEVLPGG